MIFIHINHNSFSNKNNLDNKDDHNDDDKYNDADDYDDTDDVVDRINQVTDYDDNELNDVYNDDDNVAGDVRLVNGLDKTEGRLEIFNDGEWGTVCDDAFDDEDAIVACKSLGYT
jgi:hypothetical protein